MTPLASLQEIPSAAFSSQAVSEESRAVQALQKSSEEQFRNSITYGDTLGDLNEELYEIFEDTRLSDWDGYGSSPLTAKAFIQAYQFATTLPHYIPAPELTPTSRGEIDFDWLFGDRRTLNVSISDTGMLIYAYINNLETRHGALPFEGEFPDALREIFRQVYV